MHEKQHATFYSLEWKKTGNAEFITRGQKEPKPTSISKVYKHNEDGSVVYMVTKSNQYILTLKTNDGRFVSEDIFSVIKDAYKIVTNDSDTPLRITKKFRERFEAFMRTREFKVEDHTNFIYGLYGENGIQAFFRENL